MKHLTAEAKHHILLEYAPHDATRSFAALARRHAVKGGRRVLLRWHTRWNGTAASLEEKPRTGRPRALSRAQVQQHVRAPILRSNRAFRTVKYTKLLPQVQASTGVEVSRRTLQRYGKEQLGARSTRGKKRTADERECTQAHGMTRVYLLLMLCTHKL
jgi:transposase